MFFYFWIHFLPKNSGFAINPLAIDVVFVFVQNDFVCGLSMFENDKAEASGYLGIVLADDFASLYFAELGEV